MEVSLTPFFTWSRHTHAIATSSSVAALIHTASAKPAIIRLAAVATSTAKRCQGQFDDGSVPRWKCP